MNGHLKYKKLVHLAQAPVKGTPESTGYDIHASINTILMPGIPTAVGTGLQMDLSGLPEMVELQVRPRSGLALNKGVTVLNAPGTIDRDYRGEVKIILINHSEEAVFIKSGERIAQLVFGFYLPNVTMFPATSLDENTDRGTGGFGSTGK